MKCSLLSLRRFRLLSTTDQSCLSQPIQNHLKCSLQMFYLRKKTGDVFESHMNFDVRNMYTSQWKIVQILANRFWDCWRKEYLQSLQQRRKWTDTKPNVQEGDVVLMKDVEQHRNFWPLCRIKRVFSSEDNLVNL